MIIIQNKHIPTTMPHGLRPRLSWLSSYGDCLFEGQADAVVQTQLDHWNQTWIQELRQALHCELRTQATIIRYLPLQAASTSMQTKDHNACLARIASSKYQHANKSPQHMPSTNHELMNTTNVTVEQCGWLDGWMDNDQDHA